MQKIKIPKSEIRAMKQFLATSRPFDLVWCDLVAVKKPKNAIWWGWMSPDLVNHINEKLKDGFILLPTGACKVAMK
jgi:hypothetical protein